MATNPKKHIAHKDHVMSIRIYPEVRKDLEVDRRQAQALADWIYMLEQFIRNGHGLDSMALRQVLTDLHKPNGVYEYLYGEREEN